MTPIEKEDCFDDGIEGLLILLIGVVVVVVFSFEHVYILVYIHVVCTLVCLDCIHFIMFVL